MVKINHSGALAATAGTLVAVGLLMLMMLVVEVRPAEAIDGGGAFNVTNNTTNDYSPDYSPTGEKIAYRVSHSDGLHNDIYTINVDGTGRFNVTDDKANERDPSYSPDGHKIAYAGWDGQDWEIYIINADGGERIQITNNTTDEMELDYSPDGKNIAYEGYDGQDKEIYTINLGPGRRVVQVTHNTTYDTDPTFSPSGQKIAYSGHDGRDMEIYTQYVGGGERVQLTNNTTGETELDYSPDGKKIAYVGTEIVYVNGRYVKRDKEIYTINLGPGRRVVQVTHNTRRDGEPSFSPDGQKIAYEGHDGQDREIYTILSPPPPANDNFASAQVLSGFSASANGRNAGASLQSGDPPLVGTRTTSHTVWYRWTAPFSGAVEMNTCTSDFDTLLGVYTGSALGSLTEVAANDDGCAHGSKVTFNVTKNATYKILVDGFNGNQGTFTLRVIDKTPPKVTSTTPANNATGVAPGANVIATFSEAMQGSSVTTATFKLKKAGTTTFLGATITYDPATKKATLNPSNNLQSGVTYVATVTSAAKDLAGNSLDQNSTTAGNQNKSWKFKVG